MLWNIMFKIPSREHRVRGLERGSTDKPLSCWFKGPTISGNFLLISPLTSTTYTQMEICSHKISFKQMVRPKNDSTTSYTLVLHGSWRGVQRRHGTQIAMGSRRSDGPGYDDSRQEDMEHWWLTGERSHDNNWYMCLTVPFSTYMFGF